MLSDAQKNAYANPEYRAKKSASNKKAWANPEVRKRMLEAMNTPESLARRSEARKKYLVDPNARAKISDATKKTWEDPIIRDKRREKLSGENHFNWKGGSSFEPYCPKFNREFRERVRAFYNHKCFTCGKTQAENGHALHVHHVNYDKKACCEGEKVGGRLFVALCRHCHVKTNHGNRDEWETFFRYGIALHTNGTMKTY